MWSVEPSPFESRRTREKPSSTWRRLGSRAAGRGPIRRERAGSGPLLSEAERLKALQKTVKQSSKALRAALDLCVEKGAFALEDIATATERGSE